MSLSDAAAWDRAYTGASLDPGPRPDVELHPELAAELTGRAPGRGLELGCGEGRPSIALALAGWEMTAVDFSAVGIDRGRRIARVLDAKVEWVVADVTTFRPEPGLDAVVIAYLHIEPDAFLDVLRRAAAALVPGGSLLVLGWDVSSPVGPTHRYDTAALAAAVPGTEVVRAERFPQESNDGAWDAVLHLRLSRTAAA